MTELFDLKEWFKGMTPEFREWLRDRYVQCRIDILKDKKVSVEERYFLFRHLDECSELLKKEMEEAEKQ
jgi:hypothetical protein